jgi:hypothetical protein
VGSRALPHGKGSFHRAPVEEFGDLVVSHALISHSIGWHGIA